MARVTYVGPGDKVSFDNVEIDRGETVELGESAIAHLVQSGAELEVDRESAEPASAPRPAPRPEPAAEEAVPAAPAIASSDEATPRDESAAEKE